MTAEAEIRRRIAASGPMTFAEFMEVALYHPQGGYYTGPERVGASGDFYTSPSVHPAFGALIAAQPLPDVAAYGPALTVHRAGARSGQWPAVPRHYCSGPSFDKLRTSGWTA